MKIELPEGKLKLKKGRMVSIDFETYSDIDIKKAGSWRYAMDPSTEILLLSWSADEGKTVNRWEYGDPPPVELFELIARGYVVRAWNSEFERAIWYHAGVVPLGWDPVPFSQWYDTQAAGYTHALPGKLEKAAEVLKCKVKKNKNGTRLITKFCKPRKPTRKDRSTRRKPQDDPEDFELFGVYCDDDVRVECEIFSKLPEKEFRVGEEHVWRMTNRINERGIRLDVEAFRAVQEMIDWHTEKKLERIRDLTDGEIQTPGQRDKALAWLKERDVILDSYTKDAISEALGYDEIDEGAREFLLIRQELGMSSVKKYKTMEAVSWFGRSHNNMVYHRATTGRNGGAGLQLHNFPRDAVSKSEDVLQDCIDLLIERKFEEAMLVFGRPFDIAKGLLRAMIIPDEGEVFYCADYSSVENIVTVWICQDPVGLDVFENGEDQYVAFAAKQFGISNDEVSDVVRTESKATILGAMFGAGWKTLYATNQQKGIPMTKKQAKDNVNEFRAQYAVTTESWYELAETIKEAVEKPGRTLTYKGLKFCVRHGYLWIRLHSGRFLAYYSPENKWVMTPWGQEKYQTVIYGTNSKGAWTQQTMTPSKIIENIVQATARDLLMYGQDTVNEAGFRVLLNVHDEILSSQTPDFMPLDQFVSLMVQKPEWTDRLALPLPLKAEGYMSSRYRK